MKSRLAQASVLAVGLGLMSGAGLAHHGDAGRYEDTLTTVTGTVAAFQLVNPHSILVVDVPESCISTAYSRTPRPLCEPPLPTGKIVRWQGEWGSPAALSRQGITRNTVKPRDTITLRGRRLKNGQSFMTISECSRVLDANGKELYRGNDPGQPAEEAGTAGQGPDRCAERVR